MQINHFSFESLIPEVGAGIFVPSDDDALPVQQRTAAPMPAPPPSFNEAELLAAKNAAFEEGFVAGKAEGKREADHAAMQLQQEGNQVCGLIIHRLEMLAKQHQEYLASKQAELGQLVLSCAQKIAVEALRKEPLADIEDMVSHCLAMLLEGPDAVVQVHPKLAAPLAQKFTGKVKVLGNPEINPLDCVINWQYGEANREIDEIWGKIEQTIDRYFTIAATEITEAAAATAEEESETRHMAEEAPIYHTTSSQLTEEDNHG